jgi:hypothetical protein
MRDPVNKYGLNTKIGGAKPDQLEIEEMKTAADRWDGGLSAGTVPPVLGRGSSPIGRLVGRRAAVQSYGPFDRTNDALYS